MEVISEGDEIENNMHRGVFDARARKRMKSSHCRCSCHQNPGSGMRQTWLDLDGGAYERWCGFAGELGLSPGQLAPVLLDVAMGVSSLALHMQPRRRRSSRSATPSDRSTQVQGIQETEEDSSPSPPPAPTTTLVIKEEPGEFKSDAEWHEGDPVRNEELGSGVTDNHVPARAVAPEADEQITYQFESVNSFRTPLQNIPTPTCSHNQGRSELGSGYSGSSLAFADGQQHLENQNHTETSSRTAHCEEISEDVKCGLMTGAENVIALTEADYDQNFDEFESSQPTQKEEIVCRDLGTEQQENQNLTETSSRTAHCDDISEDMKCGLMRDAENVTALAQAGNHQRFDEFESAHPTQNEKSECQDLFAEQHNEDLVRNEQLGSRVTSHREMSEDSDQGDDTVHEHSLMGQHITALRSDRKRKFHHNQESFECPGRDSIERVPADASNSSDEDSVYVTMLKKLNPANGLAQCSTSDFVQQRPSGRNTSVKITRGDPEDESLWDFRTNHKVVVMKANNDKVLGRKYDKVTYCLYCSRPMTRITRHLRSSHSHKPEVIKYMTAASQEEENYHLTLIRHRGNHLHNNDVIQKGEGRVMVVRRPNFDANPFDYQPCSRCFGWYSKSEHFKHRCVAEINAGKFWTEI